jgi:hypothetical protein
MKEPAVEKDADAEVVIWDVRVSYEDNGGQPSTVLSHYVRIKIFNERGRDAQSKVDIPELKLRGRNTKIKDIAGRTIKPDGQIVELHFPEDGFGVGVRLDLRRFHFQLRLRHRTPFIDLLRPRRRGKRADQIH